MPTITVNDTPMYFEIIGSELDLNNHGHIKPTIIVIHGGPGADHTYEVPFYKELADIAQVIFIDLRANGRSINNDPNTWNLSQWSQDIADFCHCLHIKKPFLAGDSFGGMVILQCSVAQTLACSGFILLDTEAYFDLNRIVENYRRLAGDEIAALVYNAFTTRQC